MGLNNVEGLTQLVALISHLLLLSMGFCNGFPFPSPL
jgi:hypothetical protein